MKNPVGYEPDACRLESLRLKVTEDGYTVPDAPGNEVRAALQWKNMEAFKDFLVERLLGGRMK